MILFLIIFSIGILALVVGAFAAHKAKHTYSTYVLDNITITCTVFGVFLTLIAGTILIVLPIDASRSLSNFLSQKEYVENYEMTSDYDAAAIVSKKVELNEWLYSEQYTKEHLPICSFYGDEILQIEPIK